MGIFDCKVRKEIVGYRWSPGLQIKERTWKRDPGGALYPTDIWRNATYEESGEYVCKHKASVFGKVSEEERGIRKVWYDTGVYAFHKGHPIDCYIDASLNGASLTPERARSFKAGWSFAASNSGALNLQKKLFDIKTHPGATEVYAHELLKEFYKSNQKENKTMKINIKDRTDTIEIGKLAYGTYVTGITSHPDTVYQKVDKRKTGQGITIDFPKNHSLIMNVKLGSLRVVSGDTLVSVYEAELNLSRTTNFGPYLKDNIF